MNERQHAELLSLIGRMPNERMPMNHTELIQVGFGEDARLISPLYLVGFWSNLGEEMWKKLARATIEVGTRTHYCAPWCVELHKVRRPRNMRPNSIPKGDIRHKPKME